MGAPAESVERGEIDLRTRVAPTMGELRVQPTRVDLGQVALGASVDDSVEVENTSRPARLVGRSRGGVSPRE